MWSGWQPERGTSGTLKHLEGGPVEPGAQIWDMYGPVVRRAARQVPWRARVIPPRFQYQAADGALNNRAWRDG